MRRVYETLVREHFRENRQMLFLMGPRQVGKTTTARESASALGESAHASWDDARAENLVASALLKAAHLWTDRGEGDIALYFIRDKGKREVDFLMVRDDAPWFLVEVKSTGSASLSPNLKRFQEQIGAPHAFQVAMDLPFVERDCFDLERPMIVPARTFLAQLA